MAALPVSRTAARARKEMPDAETDHAPRQVKDYDCARYKLFRSGVENDIRDHSQKSGQSLSQILLGSRTVEPLRHPQSLARRHGATTRAWARSSDMTLCRSRYRTGSCYVAA